MYFTTVFMVLVILALVDCSLEPLPDELSSRVSLSECMNSAVESFLEYGQIISLSLAITPPLANKPSAVALDHILLRKLFLSNQKALMIRKAVLRVPFDKFLRKISSYIIQIRQLEEISYTLKILKADILWNPQAKVFVISTTVFDDIASILRNIVANLWAYKIVNVVMLLPRQSNNSVYEVYTWFPFSEGRCGDDFQVQRIDSCIYGVFRNDEWFSDKIPKDLGGCPIKIRTAIIPPFVMPSKSTDDSQLDGFEVKLLNTVGEITNLSLSYSLSDEIAPYGNVFINGTMSGSYFDLMRESVDVIMGYVVPRIDTQLSFDILPSYFQDSLIICVPHSKQKNDWNELTNVANTSVITLCVFLILIMTIIILGFSRIKAGETRTFRSVTGVSFSLFELMIGTSTAILPKFGSIRLLLIIWVIFSLHFRTAYVSNLMTALSNVAYDEEMKGIEDIYEHKLSLLLYPICERYLNIKKLSSLAAIAKCSNSTICLERTAYVGDVATCTSKLTVSYLMRSFLDENGVPKIHCFKDNLVTFPIQMIMWKGFPFKTRIEQLVEKLNAAGFIYKWERDIFHNFCKSQACARIGTKPSTVLDITRLSAVFLMYGIGIAVSIMVFFVENFIFWKNTYWRQEVMITHDNQNYP